MRRGIEKILIVILFINFMGIGGFWILFLLKPTEPVTIELGTHILSEFATSLLCLFSFILFFKKIPRLKPVVFVTTGMLFYTSLQALGWTIANKMYPLLALMVINILIIFSYLLGAVRENYLMKN